MIFVVVSTGHFDPLIAACSRLHPTYDFIGQIGSSQVEPPFSHFKTASPSQLESYMARAELVVTHAGTGMLSMLYGLKKKCVVVPKQIRYGEANDGQVELARKWQELGIGVLCLDVNELSNAIESVVGWIQYFRFSRSGPQPEKVPGPHLPKGYESEPGPSSLKGAVPSQQV